MIAAWHEEKNVDGVAQFLTEKGVAFEIGESFMKGHTAFLVENGKRNIVGTMIAQKFGRFHLEHQEIELTPEEELTLSNMRALKAAVLADKKAAFDARKAKEEKIANEFNKWLDEDEEIEDETEEGV